MESWRTGVLRIELDHGFVDSWIGLEKISPLVGVSYRYDLGLLSPALSSRGGGGKKNSLSPHTGKGVPSVPTRSEQEGIDHRDAEVAEERRGKGKIIEELQIQDLKSHRRGRQPLMDSN